jgi:hypothetical protein
LALIQQGDGACCVADIDQALAMALQHHQAVRLKPDYAGEFFKKPW